MYSNKNFIDELLQNKSTRSLIFPVILGCISVLILLTANRCIEALHTDNLLKQKYYLYNSIFFTSIILIPFIRTFKNELIILFKTNWRQIKGATIFLLVTLFFIFVFHTGILKVIFGFDLASGFEITQNPFLSDPNPLSILRLLKFSIQLIGEELLFFSIFFLSYMVGKRIVPHSIPIIPISVLISIFLFGLIHLPTYDYNVIQCVFVGSGFAIRTLLFLKYQNITLCYLAHFLMDFYVVLN
ncbi:hypothetical protein COE50_06145 [Bacillus anthracis]|nr:hypothetical protein COE50_06145 [Bacillus anthracis]